MLINTQYKIFRNLKTNYRYFFFKFALSAEYSFHGSTKVTDN
jgi:hypothetical protein